ncbi:hypothetical protein CAPTEDRAFT_192293 [Capitella teleta]|uniref:Cytochrome P450 n=1 Tax=Capitella teleta TaxID=283909 RepID=R7UAT9_CAPTE|nr:hypothetical protein CAPTEDRAFT_192293 [Capitella teleta]|eukprot:ELU03104.1 hypothetical protein CAPTEDRAFT_192293 [Capitella teleta]
MVGSKWQSFGSWLLDKVPGCKEDARQFAQEHKWELLIVASSSYLAYKAIQLYRLPPGPYGIPCIGCLLNAEGFSDGSEQQKFKQKYGNIVSVQLGSDLQIWLNSADLIKEAFVNNTNEFSHRPDSLFRHSFKFQDDIISIPFDEEWKKSKKFLMSSLKNCGFGSGSLDVKVLSEADALIFRLEKLQKEAGDEGISLDEPLRWIAANLICQIIHSNHYEEDDPELKELMAMSEGKKITEHEATRTSSEPRDFIDAYLDEKAGPNLNYTKMIDNCIMFLPDSLDTLPLAIEWLVLYVARFPHTQTILHKELDDIVGRAREPQLKDKAKLNYLEACIVETYRLANIFSALLPHTVKREVRLAGYTIPRGASIHGNTIGINLDPNIFPNPLEFRPERHLDADGRFKPSEHVIPFGVGPRSCPGQSLSKMEVFLLAAKLFQTFQFDFPLNQDDSCLRGRLVGRRRRPKEHKIIVKKR